MTDLKTDIGSRLTSAAANASKDGSGDPALVVAGGALDNVKVTGEGIDRVPTNDYHGSMKLAIPFVANLGDADTVSFAIEIQESADNSAFDTAEVLQAATVAATGGSGGTVEHGVVELDVELKKRKKFVRFNITPDMSAGATDTLLWASTAELGGDLILGE